MMEPMTVAVLVTLMTVIAFFTLGMLCGQHSVWRYLRKKGHVTIDDWYYTAVKLKEGQYKRWN